MFESGVDDNLIRRFHTFIHSVFLVRWLCQRSDFNLSQVRIKEWTMLSPVMFSFLHEGHFETFDSRVKEIIYANDTFSIVLVRVLRTCIVALRSQATGGIYWQQMIPN